MVRWIVLLAGILGAAAVAIGAFAAHGMEEFLAKQSLAPEEIAKRLSQCEVGVRYHLWHTLAILTLGMTAYPSSSGQKSQNHRRRAAATICLVLGITLFSGGLYSMSIFGVMGHWAIVPSGGATLILGWLVIASMALINDRN